MKAGFILQKGKAVPIGTIKEYKGYGKYEKTAQGWKKVKKDGQPQLRITPEPKKAEVKLVVEGMSPERKEILEKCGVDCKDENAIKYVNEQIALFAGETMDMSKVPSYVKNITFMNSTIAKPTINKLVINFPEIISQLKDLGIDVNEGLSEETKRLIKPIIPDEETLKKRKIAAEEAKEAHSNLNKFESKVYEYIKENNKSKAEDKYNSNIGKILSTLRYGAISFEETMEKYKDIFEADEKVVKELKEMAAELDKLHTESEIKYRAQSSERYGGDLEKRKKDFKKEVNHAVKYDNPQVQKELLSIYKAFFLNRQLLLRGRKIAVDSIILDEVKKTGPENFVTPKEADAVKTNDDARRLFINKREKHLVQESAKKKLKGILTEKGDEKKTFSLKTVDPETRKTIERKLVENFDKVQHHFGFKVRGMFQVGDASYYNDYKKLEKEKNNVVISYHGTNFQKAAKISRGGFKLTTPKTGRMIGDGIYGADKSSKSLQYIGSGFGTMPGTRGVLFVCKNSLGKVKYLEQNQLDRDTANKFLGVGRYQLSGFGLKDSDLYDTVLAKKGIYRSGNMMAQLRNNEWCSKDPKQFIPMYWIDVEITNQGGKDSLV